MKKIAAIMVEEVSPRHARLYIAKPLLKLMAQDNGLLSIDDSFIVCLTDVPKITEAERNEIDEICNTQPVEAKSFPLTKDSLLERLAEKELADEDRDMLWTSIWDTTDRYVFDVRKAYESHPNWEELSETIFSAIIRFCTPRIVEFVGIYGVDEE